MLSDLPPALLLTIGDHIPRHRQRIRLLSRVCKTFAELFNETRHQKIRRKQETSQAFHTLREPLRALWPVSEDNEVYFVMNYDIGGWEIRIFPSDHHGLHMTATLRHEGFIHVQVRDESGSGHDANIRIFISPEATFAGTWEFMNQRVIDQTIADAVISTRSWHPPLSILVAFVDMLLRNFARMPPM